MTLSTALHSALSGLAAQGKASGVVSENIANALTPGYSRRSLEMESNSAVSAGVRVIGIRRHVDPAHVAGRRSADAALGEAESIATFASRVSEAVGKSGDQGGITTRLAAFESSLIDASSRPDSNLRLDGVALRANELAAAIRGASDTLQALRSQADQRIAAQVHRLNEALSEVEGLNARILSAQTRGAEAAGLMDLRQALIDEINVIAPVRVVERDHGQIALYTDGGAILLDGSAAELGFDPVHGIVPEMAIGGALSGLTLNGREIRTGRNHAALPGGTLAAQFRIRDELAVTAQSRLDSLARDLVERFADPAVDATLVIGAAGLFTDAGAAFDPADELGLAARIAVNAVADPAQGGDSWRLRDGLGAAAPGEAGDARFLQALAAALATDRTPLSGDFGTGTLTAAELSAAVLSATAQSAVLADERLSHARASQIEMQQIELSDGVDTDAELGQLLLIERAYGANARMIQVIDQMMQTLLSF